jgi:hypothetical protein
VLLGSCAQLIYGAKYSEAEFLEMKPVIHENVVGSMKTIVLESANIGTKSSIVAVDALAAFDKMSKNEELTPAKGDIIKTLWDDPGVQATWERRAEFQIVDSMKEYFGQLDRLSADDYIPTEKDVLLSRVRTSGIITETYEIEGITFEMYDVGGQRNERKKWIHCFDDVTAVIFVAALSEYNQRLFEDQAVNRMTEALDLFEEITSNNYFLNSSILLFLNKRDLFEEKVKKVPINETTAFADYQGGPSYEEGVRYFENKFKERFKKHDGDRDLYHHVTCATDTENVKIVFGACKDIILQSSLKESGFM